MKIKIDEFRLDAAEQVEAPLDFATLCALLAQHQAATPTARIARDGGSGADQSDPAHPAMALLLSGSRRKKRQTCGAPGSFHPAAAARFNDESR